MRLPSYLALSCFLGACGAAPSQLPVASALLHSKADQPALFLGSEPDSPAFGYAQGAIVTPLGPVRSGRVPVRIEGPLRVEANVPLDQLAVRVQRRGRLRGTPVYLAPGDRVKVIGHGEKPGRVTAIAVPMLQGRPLGRFQGSYPAAGLGGQFPKPDAQAPDAGEPFVLPTGSALTLCEAPNGKPVATVGPFPFEAQVALLGSEGGWSAVRIGSGPYLIGYTDAKLTPLPEGVAPAASSPVQPKAHNPLLLPARLNDEPGPVKRVRAGTRVSFNEHIVAVFEQDGWARVIAQYPDGQVDIIAAVNDDVTVRGLVPFDSLVDPDRVPKRAPPPRADYDRF
jgi:hypothetical protein